MTSFMTLRVQVRDIWVHTRADMGSCEGWYGFMEGAVMNLESGAVSAWVAKHFVTFFFLNM